LPDDVILSSTSDSLLVVTTQPGQVTGLILATGYDVFTESFPIYTGVGQLDGHVGDGGQGITDAAVSVLDSDAKSVAELTTDAFGNFSVEGDLPIGDYIVLVDVFAFQYTALGLELHQGANTVDIVLQPSPAGELSGQVTDQETSLPLTASISVFRSDDQVLHATTTSDPETGIYALEMPYYGYDLLVEAVGHVPQTIAITLDGPDLELDVQLEPTSGSLLVIDDTGGELSASDKLTDDGRLLAPGYVRPQTKSVTRLVDDLADLEFDVTVESAAQTDPFSWTAYDLLLVCSGDNITTLVDNTLRDALVAYVQGGGRLLIEGGEVGYDHHGDEDFAAQVLHVDDWIADESGSLTVQDPLHEVMCAPHLISESSLSYLGYGDQDALSPAADAAHVGSWSDQPLCAGVIAFDDDPGARGGQIVFFSFCYASLEESGARDLLHNAVTWLMWPVTGLSAVADAPPSILSLEQNYPNPFNPQTTIVFALPRDCHVDLRIYDLAGRLIHTLLDDDLPAARHEVIWSGRNNAGARVSSGAYIYRLQADNSDLTRRMVLIK
jgi:flagellar hook capping protein FlgD